MDNFDQTIILKFRYFTWYLITILTFSGCAEKQLSNLSNDDIEQIKKINSDYTNGWLDNDAEKVLGLYSESATIIPSGLSPIQGKEAIKEFWFPNDGSTTVIHYYNLEILDISGTNDLAYTYEHGNLSFTYEKEDFRLDRKAESHAITIYKKNESGEWKVRKRIWTDLNN
jgi:ketosteroid isomerase-like protein